MVRRPLTDTQREILQAERSAGRLEAVRTRESVARDTAHTEARVARESRLASGRRTRRIQGQVADTAISPITDTPIVLTVIFTMALLIIVYRLVTSGPQLSGFLRGASDWLAALSTTQPLFTSKPKVT